MSHITGSGRFRRVVVTTLVVLVLSLAVTSAIEGAVANATRRAQATVRVEHNYGSSGPSPMWSPRPAAPSPVLPLVVVPVVAANATEAPERPDLGPFVEFVTYKIDQSGGRVSFVAQRMRMTPVPGHLDGEARDAWANAQADRENARALVRWAAASGADTRPFSEGVFALAADVRAAVQELAAERPGPRLACAGQGGQTDCAATNQMMAARDAARR